MCKLQSPSHTLSLPSRNPHQKLTVKRIKEHIKNVFDYNFIFADADFSSTATITLSPFSTRGCIDFTDLVVDDNIGREVNEAFTIVVGGSMAMVTIIDDDG